ncbi:hypothetical protein Tco_1140191, partial [Tanacetum coccineum]
MLVEMISERKKFFAAQRAVEQRSKPHTKTQIRNRMYAYLKNMDVVKSSETRVEGSSKRAGDELESDKSEKQKINEHDIDKEDLETLWKLVKAKHGNTRPKEDYERVLWGDMKVMFEPDIKSEIWRNLQGYKVTIWKLFDTCR